MFDNAAGNVLRAIHTLKTGPVKHTRDSKIYIPAIALACLLNGLDSRYVQVAHMSAIQRDGGASHRAEHSGHAYETATPARYVSLYLFTL